MKMCSGIIDPSDL